MRTVLSEQSVDGITIQHVNYCWDANAELRECDSTLTFKYVKDSRTVRAHSTVRGTEEQIGRLIVTPPGMAVQARATATERDMEALIFHVEHDLLDRLLSKSGTGAHRADIGLDLDVSNAAIEQILLALWREIGHESAGRDVMLHSLAHILIIELVRHFRAAWETPPATLSDERLEQIRDYVNSRTVGLPQPAEVAQACGISASHLRRLFKQATGQTLQNYIESVRLQRACALLSNSDMPLKLIAWQLGFTHCSSFSYAFRRATGETPGQYRRRSGAAAGETRLFTLPARPRWSRKRMAERMLP